MYNLTCDVGYQRERQSGQRRPEPRNPSKLLVYVGDAPEGKSASRIKATLTGHLERELRISDELLGFNAAKGIVFVRVEDNSRDFDVYVQMPFTKGVTDKADGRTMLIAGDWTHHGEAMQGQYDCDKEPYKHFEGKGFGSVIRWINVGVGKAGFLGLDYNPSAPAHSGMALSLSEVQHLCRALEGFGMQPEKPVRLLEVPNIRESEQGRILRVNYKLETIDDWVAADIAAVGGRK